MTSTPHPDPPASKVNCGIISVSDTRIPETDCSGELIRQLLLEAGHQVGAYTIMKDEPDQIQAQLINFCNHTDIDRGLVMVVLVSPLVILPMMPSKAC